MELPWNKKGISFTVSRSNKNVNSLFTYQEMLCILLEYKIICWHIHASQECIPMSRWISNQYLLEVEWNEQLQYNAKDSIVLGWKNNWITFYTTRVTLFHSTSTHYISYFVVPQLRYDILFRSISGVIRHIFMPHLNIMVFFALLKH